MGHDRNACESDAFLRRKRAAERTSEASAKKAYASVAEAGKRAKRASERSGQASKASAKKGVLLRRKQAQSASAKEVSSAAKASCFDRGSSGGDPPNPPLLGRTCPLARTCPLPPPAPSPPLPPPPPVPYFFF
jgi:hypothetical protein